MRLLGSFVFLLSALSVGAYAYFPAGMLRTHPILQVVEIEGPTSAADLGVRNRAGFETRSFSPGERAFESQTYTRAAGTNRPLVQRIADQPAIAGAPNATGNSAVAPVTPGAWRTNVTNYTERSGSYSGAGAAPSPDTSHYELVRSLQRELKRVGCYPGEIDGDWGPGSKRAISSFLEKVNATLPVEKPDFILLTLLQGHINQACGLTCAAGESLGSGGNCIPNVIVARGPENGTVLSRKTMGGTSIGEGRAAKGWEARQVGAVPAPPVSAIAGQQNTPRQQTMTAAVNPPLESAPREAVPVETPARKALPGRMAVGAPPPLATTPPTTLAPAVGVIRDEQKYIARISPPIVEKLAPLPSRKSPKLAALGVAPAKADPRRLPQVTPQPTETIALPIPGDADVARERKKRASSRKQRLHVARPEPVRSATARSYGRHDRMVRTSQGRVRRGSPQHNLMLSLGGVY